MNDLQIQYFLTTAKHLSFSKAAQELFVSQPAISRQIIALEKELGCPLFERTNKNITLTANGEMFAAFFEKYRTELYDLKLRARLSLENKNRLIRLGVLNNWNISPVMFPLLKEFEQLYPNIRIEINSYEPHECQKSLQAGKEDVILTIEPQIINAEGHAYETVAKLQCVLLYNKNRIPNHLAQTAADFQNEPFLTISSKDYVSDIIRNICKPYGFTPKIQPIHSTDAMIIGVQCGLGVAITDIWSRALDNPDFGYIHLNSAHPLTVIWKESCTDHITSQFVTLLCKHIQNNI